MLPIRMGSRQCDLTLSVHAMILRKDGSRNALKR
jgi:hypothetical protein